MKSAQRRGSLSTFTPLTERVVGGKSPLKLHHRLGGENVSSVVFKTNEMVVHCGLLDDASRDGTIFHVVVIVAFVVLLSNFHQTK